MTLGVWFFQVALSYTMALSYSVYSDNPVFDDNDFFTSQLKTHLSFVYSSADAF